MNNLSSYDIPDDIRACGICGLLTITTYDQTYCVKCRKLLCVTCQEDGHDHTLAQMMPERGRMIPVECDCGSIVPISVKESYVRCPECSMIISRPLDSASLGSSPSEPDALSL